jgi:hypothetical protein
MPQVSGLSVDDTHEVHVRNRYVAAGRRYLAAWSCLQWSKMRTGHRGTECDQFTVSEHIMNLEVQIRKGCAQSSNYFFEMRHKVSSERFLVVSSPDVAVFVYD